VVPLQLLTCRATRDSGVLGPFGSFVGPGRRIGVVLSLDPRARRKATAPAARFGRNGLVTGSPVAPTSRGGQDVVRFPLGRDFITTGKGNQSGRRGIGILRQDFCGPGPSLGITRFLSRRPRGSDVRGLGGKRKVTSALDEAVRKTPNVREDVRTASAEGSLKLAGLVVQANNRPRGCHHSARPARKRPRSAGVGARTTESGFSKYAVVKPARIAALPVSSAIRRGRRGW